MLAKEIPPTPVSPDAFLEDIPVLTNFSAVTDHSQYLPFSSDWFVFIADVTDSTKAIEEGHYKDVNIVGASCIMSAANAVGHDKLLYVFGGDGATFVVHENWKEKTEKGLLAAKKMAKDIFDLDLRIAEVPISELQKRGKEFSVARWRLSENMCQTLFHGDGVKAAEELAKDKSQEFLLTGEVESTEGAFDGLECRWNPIRSKSGQILTLIVECENGELYSKAVQAIDEIYSNKTSHPVTDEQLKVSRGWAAYWKEGRVRVKNRILRSFYAAKAYIETQIAAALWDWIRRGSLRQYKDELIQQSDHRKFDGALRMVLDGTPMQHDALELSLQKLGPGVKFGVHRSKSALMTCLIFDRWKGGHMHFVDGGDGGYALAAKSLKTPALGATE